MAHSLLPALLDMNHIQSDTDHNLPVTVKQEMLDYENDGQIAESILGSESNENDTDIGAIECSGGANVNLEMIKKEYETGSVGGREISLQCVGNLKSKSSSSNITASESNFDFEQSVKLEEVRGDAGRYEGRSIAGENSSRACAAMPKNQSRKVKLCVENRFKCKECSKSFSSKRGLRQHTLFHSEQDLKCDKCDKCFSTKGHLKSHLITHTGAKLFKCDVCDKSFTTNGHLKSHLISHTGAKPFQCDVCDIIFTRKTSLRYHIRMHTGERPFKCHQCNKSFSKNFILRMHLHTHTGEKPFKCTQCDRGFSQKTNLIRHVRTHTGERPYQCLLCPEKFAQRGNLNSHKITHLRNQPQLRINEKRVKNGGDNVAKAAVKVEVVEVKFVEHLTGLEGSLLIKPGNVFPKTTSRDQERDQDCSLSDNQTDTVSAATGFPCHECHKTFNNEHNLKRHSLVHSRAKPYPCQYCDRSFAVNGNLLNHLLTHTGEKPFKCKQCTKSFTRKSALMRHYRTHTGERPFQCTECHKTFALKSGLVSHTLIHERNKQQLDVDGFNSSHIFAGPEIKVEVLDAEMNFVEHLADLKEEDSLETSANIARESVSSHDATFNEAHSSYIKQEVEDSSEATFNENHSGIDHPHDIETTQRGNYESEVDFSHKTPSSDQYYPESDKQNIASSVAVTKSCFKCKKCHKTFSRKGNLKNHSLIHTGEKRFRCKFCNKRFTQNGTLKCHIITHSGEKPFQCVHCYKCFSLKCNLKNHMITHTGEKPFNCDVCNRSFSLKSVLKSHILTHTGEKPFKCQEPGCDKVFSKKLYLTSHSFTHIGALDRLQDSFGEASIKYYADDTNKSNDSQNIVNKEPLDYNNFSEVKVEVVEIDCDENENETEDERFSDPSKALKQGLRCAQCNKIFSQKGNLRRHILTHTGEKPFKCKECDKRFAQKVKLDSHILTHTGERPFKCTVCNQGFAQKCHLKRHSSVHDGEKTFECPQCDKIFLRACNLKNHVLTHTDEGPFKCAECDKRFSLKGHLRSHSLAHKGKVGQLFDSA